MGMPSLLQPLPTLRNNCLLYLPRREYLCHKCSGSRLHFLSGCREWPSIGPLPDASSRLPWSSLEKEYEATGELEHWQGSVGWWCGGSQCRESSECLEVQEEHPQRGNEWAHHPTASLLAHVKSRKQTEQLTLSCQNPPLLSIISKKSLYSLLRNQSSLAISKLLQKWHML